MYQYYLKCQWTECSNQKQRVADWIKKTRAYNIRPTRDPS